MAQRALANRLAFNNTLHNPALTLHSFGNAAFSAALLNVFNGRVFDQFGGFVGHAVG